MSLKLWAYLGAVLALLAGLVWFGVHERGVGAAGIQASWDVEKANAATAAATQAYAVKQTEYAMSTTFAGIAATYHKAITDETPSAPAVSVADISSGRVSLRDEWTCPGGYVRGDMSGAGSSQSRADAAASRAAEQRAEGASRLIEYGDAADAREYQLSRQVIGLQDTLNAERANGP